MEFSAATEHDLLQLMSLYRAATRQMDKLGISQWDDRYPTESIIREDINSGQMQVGRNGDRIAVAYVLEECHAGEYEPAAWRYDEPRFVVLHRLCVHPDFQGQRIAQTAMDTLEAEVLSRGIFTIRLDAFSQNPVALHLYESRGYEKAGEIVYRKGLFFLYEKKLSS